MITANRLTPFSPTHPGEVIKEELECRGISQKKLSEQIGISYTMLNEILNAKRPVTETVAILLEAALGIDADIFINMQTRYNMQLARRDKSLIRRFNKVRNSVALL